MVGLCLTLKENTRLYSQVAVLDFALHLVMLVFWILAFSVDGSGMF